MMNKGDFRLKRGCVDQIFTLKLQSEKIKEEKQRMHGSMTWIKGKPYGGYSECGW